MASKEEWIVFDYEADMFSATYRLAASGMSSYEGAIKNAVVESMVLHTRILVDVLLSRGSRLDDITLGKLLPGFSPPELKPLEEAYGNPNQIGTLGSEINKRLAHATTDRSDSNDWGRVVKPLEPLIRALIDKIREERRVRV